MDAGPVSASGGRGDSQERRPNPRRRAMHSRLTCRAPFVGGALCAAAAGVLAQTTPAPNPLDAIPEKMPFDVPYGTPIPLERASAAVAAAVAQARRHDWEIDRKSTRLNS